MHPTTTSHSWAAFMNGNHLQKVRIDPALSVGIIFVCFFNPVAFQVDAGGIGHPDQRGNRGGNMTPGQRGACRGLHQR